MTTDTDWEQIARAALATGASKGMKRLNRRTLTDLCERLAAGTPLETASRLLGIQPNVIRAWAESRPPAWQAIEKARAVGENLCLLKIAAATDWKAADRLLTLQRPEYREDRGAGGLTLQVVLNVPVPQALGAGDRARVIEGAAVEAPEPAKLEKP